MKKINDIIDVKQIPAMNKKFISEKIKNDVQDLYIKMENFYNRYQLREIKRTHKFNQFKKCLFCIHQYDLKASLPFAKVFIEADGTVVYEIIGIHLEKLNLTLQGAEMLAIQYLYTPVLSNYFDCWFSVYSHIDAFFSVLEGEKSYDENGFTCIPYQIETDFEGRGIKEKVKQDDNKSIKEKAHILPEGIILIYR